MKPTKIHHQLSDFIEALNNDSIDISIDTRTTKMFDQFMIDESFQKRFKVVFDESLKLVESAKSIVVNEDQRLTFCLFSAHLRWRKVDRVHGNVPMYGGFAFNQGEAMVMESLEKWKESYADFIEYEEEISEDKDLLSNLTWFESPTHQFGSQYIPYYGSVRLREGSFPYEFYFFDGGVIYPLPFNSYEEYIQALILNVGLECWQYFYVDPEVLVRKNKGLNYMTTNLRKGTRLVEGMNIYQFNPDYNIDRLDLIHEYLKRCVKFLPPAFPSSNFDHQKVYLDKLNSLL
jgi:hypothetical protein